MVWEAYSGATQRMSMKINGGTFYVTMCEDYVGHCCEKLMMWAHLFTAFYTKTKNPKNWVDVK